MNSANWVRRRAWLTEHPGSIMTAAFGRTVKRDRRVYGPRPDPIAVALERAKAETEAAADGKRGKLSPNEGLLTNKKLA
jgi:hypothetical protein